MPAALVGAAAQAACLGARDTVTPMISVAVAAGFNLLGDLILVPTTGIVGAAVATAASQYAAALLLLDNLRRKGFLGRRAFRAEAKHTDATDAIGGGVGVGVAAKKTFLPASRKAWLKSIAPFFAFGPFFFCCIMKQLLHTVSICLSICVWSWECV